MDLSPHFTRNGEDVLLRGSRCTACGRHAFPARATCAACASRGSEPVMLSGLGTVHAFTQVVRPPAGFERPYLLGAIDLDEGPRVFAQLTDRPPADGRVRAVPAAAKHGQAAFAFAPRP